MTRPHVRIYTSDACSFCERAKRLLARRASCSRRSTSPATTTRRGDHLVELTGRYTVPQILIDERPVGGYDDIKALDDAGALDAMLGLAA